MECAPPCPPACMATKALYRHAPRFVWLAMALVSCAGCSSLNQPNPLGKLDRMVLVSNVAETRFLLRPKKLEAAPDADWVEVGRGLTVSVEYESGARLDVAARAPGYREKRVALTEPVPRYAFRFLEADRAHGRVVASGSASAAAVVDHGSGNVGVGQSERAGKRWAVIVGVSRYKFGGAGGFGALEFADKDAADFHRLLQRLGWDQDHIKLLIDEGATKRKVEYALETWLRRAAPDDTVVIFWSSHGWPDPDNPEKAFFACFDSRPSDPSSGLRMDRVRDMVSEREARNVLFIADTCHSGKVIRSGTGRGIGIVPALEAMERAHSVPRGWIFVASADPDRAAYEDKAWQNGALTHVLLSGMEGAADGYQSAGLNDGRITMGELREFIKDRMAEETLQILGARIEPLFFTTSGDPKIWEMTLAWPGGRTPRVEP